MGILKSFSLAMLLSRFLGRFLRRPSPNEKYYNKAQPLNGAYDIPSTESNGNLSSVYRGAIRSILRDFLGDMNLTFPSVTYDDDFAEDCCQLSVEHGCPSDVVRSNAFQTALQGGVSITTTAYEHLDNPKTRQFICLYTTCLIVFDDLSKTDASSVREFHSRFITDRPQLHSLLDLFAGLLRSSEDHLLPTCANLLVSSSLDFITGLIVDHDFQSMKVDKNAISYPRWVRTMMGISTAFALFAFPPDIPLISYVQIIPNMVHYIDDVNDIFSFYKEESEHENTNHISLLAQLSGKPKLQCMKELAAYSVDESRRCQMVLSVDPKALKAFNEFIKGYIGFYALAHRYNLGDLDLGDRLAAACST